MNGANPESIENAYENYKKTIGTFDALITCRDYMNKIYSLVDDINIPLCSNIKVSDIRNDINRSQVLCSFNNYGINYIEQATKLEDNTDSIDSFTLMLYPFKTIYSTASKTEYDNSFKYTADKYNEITQSLTDYKTICHKFKTPAQDELTCIKNYLRLDARITTTSKVNSAEEAAILVNVRKAIYENFNMRKLDFGQEIPFDSILNVIESADTRIKSVSLDEPTLCTEFQTADGNEYALASLGSASATDAAKIKELYNKLTVRNILAGRVSLFKYDTSFKAEFDEGKYDAKDIKPIYPEDDNTTGIKRIRGICTLPVSAPVTLTEGEVAKFRFPSIRTTITYSAYTNYFLKLSTDSEIPAKAAKMMTLGEFLENNSDFWNNLTTADVWSEKTAADSDIVSLKTKYIKIYNEDHTAELTTIEAGTNYTYIDLSQETHVSNFNNVLKNFAINDSVKYSGLYRASSSSTGVHGKLVDEDNTKYLEVTR